MHELFELERRLDSLLRAGRGVGDPEVAQLRQDLITQLDAEMHRLDLVRETARPPAAPDQLNPRRITQLRCCICDHWYGNGGGCSGKAECREFCV
jgi:hypothetical protein